MFGAYFNANYADDESYWYCGTFYKVYHIFSKWQQWEREWIRMNHLKVVQLILDDIIGWMIEDSDVSEAFTFMGHWRERERINR